MLDQRLPSPIEYRSHREFVRETLRNEVDLGASGFDILPAQRVPTDSPSHAYRAHINSDGSPSDRVADGYVWTPGTELTRRAARGRYSTRLRP